MFGKNQKDFTVEVYKVTNGFRREVWVDLTIKTRKKFKKRVNSLRDIFKNIPERSRLQILYNSLSSAIEVLNQLIGKELNFISVEIYDEFRKDLEHITAMLNKLHKASQYVSTTLNRSTNKRYGIKKTH